MRPGENALHSAARTLIFPPGHFPGDAAQMGIEPPDPGHALALAKSCTYDATTGGFRDPTTGALRWLWPEGGRVWTAISTPERTVTHATYNLLREGRASAEVKSVFYVGRQAYSLLDSGFTADAVEV